MGEETVSPGWRLTLYSYVLAASYGEEEVLVKCCAASLHGGHYHVLYKCIM